MTPAKRSQLLEKEILKSSEIGKNLTIGIGSVFLVALEKARSDALNEALRAMRTPEVAVHIPVTYDDIRNALETFPTIRGELEAFINVDPAPNKQAFDAFLTRFQMRTLFSASSASAVVSLPRVVIPAHMTAPFPEAVDLTIEKQMLADARDYASAKNLLKAHPFMQKLLERFMDTDPTKAQLKTWVDDQLEALRPATTEDSSDIVMATSTPEPIIDTVANAGAGDTRDSSETEDEIIEKPVKKSKPTASSKSSSKGKKGK
jgi:hypothetical protein